MKEDKVILDPAKQAEEVRKKNEEAKKKIERNKEALSHLDELMNKQEELERTVEKATEDLKQKTQAAQQPKYDHRPKQDFDTIMARDLKILQNDMDISNAISKKDLDMALYYFLDQIFVLESFTVGIIRYFEWKASGEPIPENHLRNFMPCIAIVEEWMEIDEHVRHSDSKKRGEYESKFKTQMKKSMEGLLEPYGSMLSKSGFFNTMKTLDTMETCFFDLLEKIISRKDHYFDKSKFTQR